MMPLFYAAALLAALSTCASAIADVREQAPDCSAGEGFYSDGPLCLHDLVARTEVSATTARHRRAFCTPVFIEGAGTILFCAPTRAR